MMYAIVAGCSHTSGTGLEPKDVYVNLLANHYVFPVINYGVPGGNCHTVLKTVVDIVKQDNRPAFIIAQWPNFFRKTAWIGGKLTLQNINSSDESFKLLLSNGEENFYETWVDAVIVANLLCKLTNIPLINILFESIDQRYLDRLAVENIVLHHDEKLPNRTWFFDNGASDKQHHSPWCHSEWTKRLIGIIDENTTR